MKLWSAPFTELSIEHKGYWRARLVSCILLIACALFFVLFCINALYFKDLDVSIIDGIGFIAASGIYVLFRRKPNIEYACWATTLMVVVLLMSFVVLVGGYSHSLFWATLIPPIAFFLVGSKWGTLISVICFSICIFVVYQQVESQQTATFKTGALLNVIEVCIAHIFLFRFYEHSRASAYKQLRDRNEEISALAEIDKLTQLYNREKLDSALNALAKHSAKHRQPLSLMILDIDHFKKINDEHGHLEGDKVLSELALKLKAKMRQDDLLARWGGEEFVILLKNTPLNIASELAERLRVETSAQAIVSKKLTLSIGVGEFNPPESTEQFLSRVDGALYKAKEQGRDRVVTASKKE
uniref:GGDEF domain-containing protein n=1 Tax=Ningiella ruwaisensis TaxID=2364274 RepID=UPI0010A077CF|nr:GGDEF domain-containing protein [Ningiella ruwaisensis]